MRRPDIGNTHLLWTVLAIGLILVGFFLLQPHLPKVWRTPGSPELYLTGVTGAALLLVSMVFVLVKRTGHGGSPVAWFVAHVFAASAGTVLVVIHSAGYLRRPPALLFLAILGLIALGVWARVRLARRMSATFGTKHQNFRPLDTSRRTALQAIITQKQDILSTLDPNAREGTFSLTLAHWLCKPGMALAYARLVRAENRLMGTRDMVGAEQAYWRPLHLVLAYLFVLGIFIHIITVTFFAGYVADYGEIDWWHLAEW
jgi:hypothetical protein